MTKQKGSFLLDFEGGDLNGDRTSEKKGKKVNSDPPHKIKRQKKIHILDLQVPGSKGTAESTGVSDGSAAMQ